jgi:hypothetical protein
MYDSEKPCTEGEEGVEENYTITINIYCNPDILA